MTTHADRDLFAGINGHDLISAGFHVNGDGSVDHSVVTKARRSWSWLQRGQRDHRERRAGGRLIGTGAVLLVLLGAGLLAVSYAAQYRYVLDQRHQAVASLIEAGALDVGLIIFSLLALGLAMAGLASKTERAAIVLCAVASAVMNYAAADVTSPRSVLAFVMPPIFLAFVVDRVVSTVRRHVLGIREGRSPWAVLADAAAAVLRLAGLVTLYGLRFLVAAPSTCTGLRRCILAAAPLPAAAELTTPETSPDSSTETSPERQPRERRRQEPRPAGQGRSDTKTARFLAAVRAKYGDFAAINEDRVSPICTELASTVGLHCGAARTALRAKVLAALPAGEGDVR